MIDFATLVHLLQCTDMPVLPSVFVTQAGLQVAWAMVLGAVIAWAGTRLSPWLRWSLVLLALVLTLLPGPRSPAYWLGLAFQMPSLTSVLLCLVWLMNSGWAPRKRFSNLSMANPAPLQLCQSTLGLALQVVATLLGWVLLADLLALWPVSVYSWGFGPAALAGVGGVLAIEWLLVGNRRQNTMMTALLAAVLGLYVLTRLPSGNVWDALLDPWLWLVIQISLTRRLWNWARGRL